MDASTHVKSQAQAAGTYDHGTGEAEAPRSSATARPANQGAPGSARENTVLRDHAGLVRYNCPLDTPYNDPRRESR